MKLKLKKKFYVLKLLFICFYALGYIIRTCCKQAPGAIFVIEADKSQI